MQDIKNKKTERKSIPISPIVRKDKTNKANIL